MRTFILISVLCCLLAAPSAAQPNMEGMDFYPLMTEDGFRIFFDDSVTWEFGGIIPDPALSFWQTQPLVDAYFVLTHPTAAQLGGFRVRSQILGNHVITGWEVHDCELGEYAAALVHRAVLLEGCVGQPLVLHADNGAIQKGSTLRAKLEFLGVSSSFSRPRVSNKQPVTRNPRCVIRNPSL